MGEEEEEEEEEDEVEEEVEVEVEVVEVGVVAGSVAIVEPVAGVVGSEVVGLTVCEDTETTIYTCLHMHTGARYQYKTDAQLHH